MTALRGGDWSPPTHYAGGQQIEPRMFTEADPMASLLVADWAGDEKRGAPGAQWGTTTYVGRAGQHAGAEQQGRDAAAAEGSNRKLLANSGSIAVASLVSRITGFVRTVLLGVALGAGAVGNAYNSGNNLPNMIYELLLGGVLSSVLIPLLVKAQTDDKDEGVAYTQRLLSIATAGLGVMTIVVVAAAPWIAGPFSPAGSQRELTNLFATLLLPEIFFYGLGAMLVAVLNIRHRYLAGAWAPVLNNVIMIATLGIFWLLPGPASLNPTTITNAQVVVLGVGTTLGIAAQAFAVWPSLRATGFHWAWRFRARPNEVGRMREVGTLAGWVLVYVVVSQLGVSVIQYVGNHNGGFTVFTLVDLLFQMPYGILVVSLLTAIMPRMSRAAVRGDVAAVVGDLRLGARLAAIAMIPITAWLIALAPPATVSVFGYGELTIAKAHLVGTALAWSAFGLFPFAIVMLQLRVFYAYRDGKTPTLINIFMVGTKVALVLLTDAAYAAPHGVNVNVHPSIRAVEWLNIATSLSYVIGAIVGHFVLTRRLGLLGFSAVGRTIVQIAVASAVSAAAAYAVVVLARDEWGSSRLGSAMGALGGALAAIAVLALIVWQFRLPDVREAITAVRRG